MPATSEMQTINNVLLNTQGATGVMLSEGLFHALQDPPEERHELQVELLKMATQVLSAAQSAAKVEEELTCQRQLEAAQAELQTHEADAVSAQSDLRVAEERVSAQKEKLDALQRQLTTEEEEHARLQVADEEKAREVAAYEESKNEVVGLLDAMNEQGSGDRILNYLRSAKAEAPLVSALASVLKKAPRERCGFDDVALAHLQSFLEQKVAYWTQMIDALLVDKSNVHAEALGAWAVKEVAGQHIHDARMELESCEAEVADAQEKLKLAKQVAQGSERALGQARIALTMAAEKSQQCAAALQSLSQLEAGPKEVATGMDVDEDLAASKMGAMMDTEMVLPILA